MLNLGGKYFLDGTGRDGNFPWIFFSGRVGTASQHFSRQGMVLFGGTISDLPSSVWLENI